MIIRNWRFLRKQSRRYIESYVRGDDADADRLRLEVVADAASGFHDDWRWQHDFVCMIASMTEEAAQRMTEAEIASLIERVNQQGGMI